MTDPQRYKLPETLAEAHLEIIHQANLADEAERYLEDHPTRMEIQSHENYEKNRMLRAENRSLKIALAEALKPPEDKLAETEAKLHRLEDGLRQLLETR